MLFCKTQICLALLTNCFWYFNQSPEKIVKGNIIYIPTLMVFINSISVDHSQYFDNEARIRNYYIIIINVILA